MRSSSCICACCNAKILPSSPKELSRCGGDPPLAIELDMATIVELSRWPTCVGNSVGVLATRISCKRAC